MSVKIALAGNPNSGKTTLFNALTGSNQFVGNWPGVTVEKKEGKLKFQKDVVIMDLPGIYSLSPYTLEEVVARNYLINEKPDAVLNIVDGSNLERNLYLTTQLTELGIPVVVAINMMDVVEKAGNKIDTAGLSKLLGCAVVEISALKGTGVKEAAMKAVEAAQKGKAAPLHPFSSETEHAIAHIEDLLKGKIDKKQERWFAIKAFEGDEKVMEQLKLDSVTLKEIKDIVKGIEDEFEDDSESIITNERYVYISKILKGIYKKQSKGKLTASDKIDKIVTNRILALPIFAVIMFIVYYISVTTVGTIATDWANDGVFGDGWHLFGIGTGEYEEAAEPYADAATIVNGFAEYFEAEDVLEALDSESEDYDPETAVSVINEFAAEVPEDAEAVFLVSDEETLADEEVTASAEELNEAVAVMTEYGCEEPDPADYGVWIPGVPVFIESALSALGCADWLSGLILDGIVAGVGAVLGFVPQMLILFIFLAFLEACGYMARVAFIMDRIFRKFGLSGKSFIPMLIGSGCGIPGIMASRTIESDRDRKMTIMTTTFIPCGAKLPFIAMIAGAIFGGAAWVAPSAYFLGVAAIIVSGIMLKKTKLFVGDPAPFVMELPAYHLPTVGTVLRSMWERGWSFIKKAGTIILLSTIVVWFATYFGFVDGAFGMLTEEQIDCSILAAVGRAIGWIFTPQGWGNWQAAVASITGLIAKENIVGTLGILYSAGDGTVYQNMFSAFNAAGFGTIAGYSFLVFNLLCAPCFAAMGAIRREMNNGKWFAVAIGYQCGFAYVISLIVYQLGKLFAGGGFGLGTIVAVILLVGLIYLIVRPQKNASETSGKAVRA